MVGQIVDEMIQESNIIRNNSKEIFYEELDKMLIAKGFSGNNNIWTKSFSAQTQSSVMIINGQRMEQPGQPIQILYKLEVIGDGEVSGDQFSQINFKIQQGKEVVVDLEECIYYDELKLINEIINKLYK